MMSNPSLPQISESGWPMQELAELTRASTTLLGATRVWLALVDRAGNMAPHVAAMVERGAAVMVEPLSFRQFTEAVIATLRERRSTDPLIVANIQQAPDLLRVLGASTAPRSLAAVPLVNGARVIGALIAASEHVGAFSEVVREPLNMLADMAVTTIRLAADLQRNAAQANELSALLNAARALTSSLDSQEVFRAIIESIKGVIRCDSALIYDYDERTHQLRVIASMGEGPSALRGATVPINDPSSKAAWVVRETQTYNGVVRPEDDIGALTDKLRPGETFALLCVPLISRGRLRGVASLAREDTFSQPEVGVMERLCTITAAALENVALFNTTQAARQQQEALFASASDGFALVDEARRFARVNAAFGSYLSTHPDTLDGKVCCQMFSTTPGAGPIGPATCRLCHDEPECLMLQVMKSGATRDHVECVFPSLDPPQVSEPTLGTRAARVSAGPSVMGRVIDFSLTPIVGPDQRPRVLLVGRDVSGPREVQRFRAEQIQLISHEMAAPLMTISANIEFFLTYSGTHFTPEQIEVLDTARATAMSMRTLVDDLDLISRRDAGELRIDLKPTDITQEAREAVNEMSILARQKGISLLPRIAPQAPLAMADPTRVRQVARNLISNAIKFTPQGGHIRVVVASDADWVTLQVEDTGMGIPDSDHKKIWNRYYQSPHTANAGAQGRGLGLAIVRIIVRAHQGMYDVRSALGRGTVFTIAFPRADRATKR